MVDIRTRQIIGWRLGSNHTSELTYSALIDALSRSTPPAILHSDQGSEYLSHKRRLICQRMEIQMSASNKGSPWQSTFVERTIGTIKDELGDISQHKDLAQLIEAIGLTTHYYNTERIHTSLKTTPAAYAASLSQGVD